MKPNCCIFLKKPSWYGSINIIMNIFKTTNTDINLLKKTLGKFKNNVNIFLKSLFITEWKKQINQFSDSKLKILIYVRIILS
jgi:hypothetical protein